MDGVRVEGSGVRLDAVRSETVGSVVFVGSRRFFSDRFMALVRNEFREMEVVRVPSLRAMRETRAMRDTMELCVLEETQVPELIQRHDACYDAAGSAQIVLAYYSAACAERLISARTRQNGFGDIGFLPLNAPIDIWLAALRLLLFGELFVPRELIGLIGQGADPIAEDADLDGALGPSSSMAALDSPLTPRETQVLRLVAKGKQNKVIAEELGLSEHTVKLHIHHVLGKLNVSNRTGATMWYLKQAGAMSGGVQAAAV